MKNIVQLLIVLSFILGACNDLIDCEEGKGAIVSRTLSLDNFNSLQLSGSDKLYISQGAEQEVVVEGQQNIIDLISLDVQTGLWDIHIRGCIRRHEPLVYYVTLPEISLLSLSGSGDIVGENTLSATNLKLKVTGSGAIFVDLDASVDAEITGSGEINLSGEAESADVKLTGSGTFGAYDLEVDYADLSIEGSGDAFVWVRDEMNVSIAGSGNVYYKGNPEIDYTISGSGQLISRN